MDTKGFQIHPILDAMLKNMELFGYTVVITELGRTFSEHIEVYRQIARKLNKEFSIDDVPLSSYHLPCFTTVKARAVDFHLIKDGKLVSYFELVDAFKKALGENIDQVGYKVSKIGNWMHVDARGSSWNGGYYEY